MSASIPQLAVEAISYARRQIEQYGVPDMLLLDISLEKARWISDALKARTDLVEICVAMMDVKLGQAFQEKRIAEHVRMSMTAAKEFLESSGLPEVDIDIVLNAVEAHHGGVPFKSIEAEICANADCYRFIHPKGVFLYFTVLGKRLGDFKACLDQVEAKMDEKMSIVSLPIVKEELGPVYDTFKRYLASAR